MNGKKIDDLLIDRRDADQTALDPPPLPRDLHDPTDLRPERPQTVGVPILGVFKALTSVFNVSDLADRLRTEAQDVFTNECRR